MKVTDGNYFGARNITLDAKWLYLDLDARRRGQGFGFCFGGRFGSETGKYGERTGPGWCLDIHAPMGEPDRLHLFGRRLHAIIGLRPGQGSQAWSWRRSEYTRRCRWLTVAPANFRERFDRAHPAAVTEREVHMRRRHVWMTYSNESMPAWWFGCPARIGTFQGRRVNCSACGDLEPLHPFDPDLFWLALWNDAQVAALEDWQRKRLPYTCGGGLHAERDEKRPMLIATQKGWRCPDGECAYTQNWAYAIS